MKWSEAESSVEENDDFLTPEFRVLNIPRSLSDSVDPVKCIGITGCLSDSQTPCSATGNDGHFAFGLFLADLIFVKSAISS